MNKRNLLKTKRWWRKNGAKILLLGMVCSIPLPNVILVDFRYIMLFSHISIFVCVLQIRTELRILKFNCHIVIS